MLTYADVCTVAHGGGGHAALHTGVCRLSPMQALLRLFLAIQALLKLCQGLILLYTQALFSLLRLDGGFAVARLYEG